jgi:hypothetical protein
LEGCVVVPIVLDISGVPVDKSTGPVDGSLAVGGETCRPEGELNTSGSLGEVPLVRRCIPGVGSLLYAAYLSIYQPCDRIGCPVNFVGVVVVEGVRKGDVEFVVICSKLALIPIFSIG